MHEGEAGVGGYGVGGGRGGGGGGGGVWEGRGGGGKAKATARGPPHPKGKAQQRQRRAEGIRQAQQRQQQPEGIHQSEGPEKGKGMPKGSTKSAGPKEHATAATSSKGATRDLLHAVHKEAPKLNNTEHQDDDQQRWQFNIHDMSNRAEINDVDFRNPLVVLPTCVLGDLANMQAKQPRLLSRAHAQHYRAPAHVRHVPEVAGPPVPEPQKAMG